MIPPDALSLADWRRRVVELYGRVRHTSDPQTAWQDFRATRDDLFKLPLAIPAGEKGFPKIQRARTRRGQEFLGDLATLRRI